MQRHGDAAASRARAAVRSTRVAFARGAWLALAVAAACSPTAWAAKSGAEYSLRWDPAQGGPASGADALAVLALTSDKRSVFEVMYFDIAAPVDTPPGFDNILRKRTTPTQTQLTFKQRGATPFPAHPSLTQWHCPLPHPQQRKQEADVSFVSADGVSRANSRSCSHSSQQPGLAVPAALHALPKGCKSTMTRLESGKLKVEQWQLADGSTLLEVSRLAADSDKARAAFRDQVVKPLLAAQARPQRRSKSALGGDCAK